MIQLASLIAGEALTGRPTLAVHHPYDGSLVGSVQMADRSDLERAIEAARAFKDRPTRAERRVILEEAARTISSQSEEFAQLITAESGLALKDTRYEVSRTIAVLRTAAVVALDDEGASYPCDVVPNGRARRIYTRRDALPVAAAITPFNHPLNQVAHKVAPAIAAGTPLILKPSEKTPLSALKFAACLYEAGLKGPMLSVLLGEKDAVTIPLVRHENIPALSFTGSLAIGRFIANNAGYKKIALELGGNSPLIVMDDADLDLAAQLAAEGSFRNSGQRCTAVKRILVQESVREAFTQRLLEKAASYKSGDPRSEETVVGTVIDEPAAARLVDFIQDAIQTGATLGLGGECRGALLAPTVLLNVNQRARLWREEAFGPLAPVFSFETLEDAITLANDSDFGLATGVVTSRIDRAFAVIKGVQTGTVNVNEVPGFRLESTPFGGIKGSGIGVKEGVVEATRFFSFTKTFSLPF